MTLNKTDAIHRINSLVNSNEPFLLVSDFGCQKNHVLPLTEVNPNDILFEINGSSNFTSDNIPTKEFMLSKDPISYQTFLGAFDQVQHELKIGNTYLTNLTFPTSLKCNHSIKEIFYRSKAKYKLWMRDRFVVFSPEIFVQWKDGILNSFPMKGTIDADVSNAKEKILHNEKEMAEHTAIVDLIRNDMSIYAKNVNVEKFRYVDEIQTHEKRLLQVSSKITADLNGKSAANFGEVLFSLMPGGSISGAPKESTIEIIKRVESYERGYYTGVCGLFDGKNFDSGIMIRFIEQQGDNLVFKSGGGIHILSDPEEEYQEMIDKVYVPIY